MQIFISAVKWLIGSKMKCFVFLLNIYTILPKVLGRPLLMNRFDYFSNFYEQWRLQVYGCTLCVYHERSDWPEICLANISAVSSYVSRIPVDWNSHAINYELSVFCSQSQFLHINITPNINRNLCCTHVYHEIGLAYNNLLGYFTNGNTTNSLQCFTFKLGYP